MVVTGEQYEIRSGGAVATVTGVGAGLRSFSVDGVPYTMSFGPDEHPPLGAGGVLVPWPNRVAGARWTWRGETYELEATEPATGNAIHGLLRTVPWYALASFPDAVTLAADVPASAGWPQPVRVETSYAVTPAGLTVTHSITNVGDGEVPVGLGTHPYLRAGEAAPEDCTLTVDADAVLDVDRNKIPVGEPRPPAEGEELRGGATVRDLHLDTCYRAAGTAHELRAPDGAGVRLWTDAAFGWVMVFTPEDWNGQGKAVAVEPMTCPPDALNSHTDLAVLTPDQTWTVRWGLTPLGERGET